MEHDLAVRTFGLAIQFLKGALLVESSLKFFEFFSLKHFLGSQFFGEDGSKKSTSMYAAHMVLDS